MDFVRAFEIVERFQGWECAFTVFLIFTTFLIDNIQFQSQLSIVDSSIKELSHFRNVRLLSAIIMLWSIELSSFLVINDALKPLRLQKILLSSALNRGCVKA